MIAQVTAISMLLLSIRHQALVTPAYWAMWLVVLLPLYSQPSGISANSGVR